VSQALLQQVSHLETQNKRIISGDTIPNLSQCLNTRFFTCCFFWGLSSGFSWGFVSHGPEKWLEGFSLDTSKL